RPQLLEGERVAQAEVGAGAEPEVLELRRLHTIEREPAGRRPVGRVLEGVVEEDADAPAGAEAVAAQLRVARDAQQQDRRGSRAAQALVDGRRQELGPGAQAIE